MAVSLAYRLDLRGKALKLTVKDINNEEIADIRVFALTVKPREHQVLEAFAVNPFNKESLNLG